MNMSSISVVHLVILAVLLQYLWFGWLVGKLRAAHGIRGPATMGHPEFERMFRVQQNTLENMVVLVPAMMICAHEFDSRVAAACGLLFMVGREVYRREYMSAKSRQLGFAISLSATVIAILGGAYGAARSLL